MRINLLLLLFLLSLCSSSFAANRIISGTVRGEDNDKETLIGVSVFYLVGDSKKTEGTVTDIDGNFSFSVPDNVKQIKLTYLGYEELTVKLTDKTNYNVVLASASHRLGDVVVTGYQEIERRKITAAISKVEIGDETVGSLKTLDQALIGQVAGVTAITTSGSPGAPVKIRIRGTASLNGSQDPLWVLDGMPMEGTDIPKMGDLKDIDEAYSTSIAGINPNDIESITVLKDAAATAIYGARAANGVIVITTKKGRVGKPVINFSTRLSYSPKTDIDRMNLMNSNEKVQLELDLLRTNYSFRDNKGSVANIINNYGLTSAYKAGGWDALPSTAQNEINQLRDINTDWNDILFRSAFNQEYNVSISGGGEKTTYYTSLGYYEEKGNVKKVGTNRFNLTTKINYSISDRVKFGASVFGSRRQSNMYITDYRNLTNPTYYSRMANPYQKLYDESGKYIYDANIQYYADDAVLDFNVFEEQQNTKNENIAQSLNSIFDLRILPTDDITLSTQIGLQTDATSIEKIALKDTYAMRYEFDRTKYLNSDGVKESFLPKNGGYIKQNENKQNQITWKGLAEYRKAFNVKHEVEAMLGSEIRKGWYKTLFTAGYGYDERTHSTQPVLFPSEDKTTQYPLYKATKAESAYVSFFSTASYTFDRRYTVGGSIRFDGSDIYGVSSKYKYTPLYSLSGLWRISSESFMKDVKWIDNLALRSSYGLQGNLDKSTSHFLKGKYLTNSILPGYYDQMVDISSLPNRNLRWEKTENYNIGLDFSVLSEALSVGLNYYRRNSSDLIGIRDTPHESGWQSIMENWAEMNNEGYEISISSRNIQTKDFTWYTNFNLGFNKNKVTRVNAPSTSFIPSVQGYPVDAIFALKSGGLDAEGYPLFINANGDKVTAKEMFKLTQSGASVLSGLTAEETRALYTYIGPSTPLYSGGLTNTFRYKAFELGVNCIFNLGHYVRTTPSYALTRYDRGLNSNRDILNRWTPTNTNTNFPALISNDKRIEEYTFFNENTYGVRYENMFDTHVKKGDYMRIQNIRFAYNLPQSIMQMLYLKIGTVAIEGRNLFVVGRNYKNSLDPETMGNPYAQPIPKSFVFTLNVNL